VPEDETAPDAGQLPVDVDLVFGEFVKGGGEIEVVFKQDVVGQDGGSIATHKLEDVDVALVLLVVVFVGKGQDLLEG
jgi:hypothetical protein